VPGRVHRERGGWLSDAPLQGPGAYEPVIPDETTLVLRPGRGRCLRPDPRRRARASSGAGQRAERRCLGHADHARDRRPRPGSPRRGTQGSARRRPCRRADQQGGAPPDRTPARETAERLLREPAIESVMLTALRGEEPVLEICTR
jgi:hypothetical protein